MTTMAIVLILVTMIVPVYVVAKIIRRSILRKKLISSASYEVAIEIKEALTDAGYTVDDPFYRFAVSSPCGIIAVGDEAEGFIEFSYDEYGLIPSTNTLYRVNKYDTPAVEGHRNLGVQFDLFVLIRTKNPVDPCDPPEWFKIAAETYAEIAKRHEGKFMLPHWAERSDDYEEYLNTMFR